MLPASIRIGYPILSKCAGCPPLRRPCGERVPHTSRVPQPLLVGLEKQLHQGVRTGLAILLQLANQVLSAEGFSARPLPMWLILNHREARGVPTVVASPNQAGW